MADGDDSASHVMSRTRLTSRTCMPSFKFGAENFPEPDLGTQVLEASSNVLAFHSCQYHGRRSLLAFPPKCNDSQVSEIARSDTHIGKGMTWICIAHCRDHTSKALRYGTPSQGII